MTLNTNAMIQKLEWFDQFINWLTTEEKGRWSEIVVGWAIIVALLSLLMMNL